MDPEVGIPFEHQSMDPFLKETLGLLLELLRP
jgi:hypothetical protein